MAKAVDSFLECDITLKIPDVELSPSLKVRGVTDGRTDGQRDC